jgi:hypothetical protein
MGEYADESHLYRALLHVSGHAWSLASSPISPEALTPDPRLTPPCEEEHAPVYPDVAHLRRDGGLRRGEDHT